ncbi:Putative pre-peptidase OS=Singulisphaera acidiphila (strain ATCC BAA-1392 / DSM 18658 / VKM B-2454 / MOB10) GN=Sinac_2823 PE=4 SV=1 [Gemmata massiliana]|uniref:Peptidase C-terminal archaeal/bacterial domain-containing protein n=1 Tax=Gemmata massiliana TaxID=1210884 RepID=A0A6P2DHV1_9BACT|nr:hypothetical protein [Gemmata massiliana]VTS00851.1 Putative pre-peptidase OS=Singulisphaera acidiphila (strain ATCC BAA-1392 / DSM 18658 / VKM B-2454 / MOB10) GN=Sinac_2823 PE=4 SV=1 [Gemmata massiliana]
MFRVLFLSIILLFLCIPVVFANPPTVNYIFPAGAQRGTSVDVRVGGLFLYDKPAFEVTGPGLTHSPHLAPAKRVWFEGPLLPLPESQQQEDYPADTRGNVAITKDAPLGSCRVRVFTSQGAASGARFVVGELPEVVEQETGGDPIPVPIQLPVTANGRVFPRDDIDLWEFDAPAGTTVTAFVHAQSLNSPLVSKLDILDAKGTVVAEQMLHPCIGTDGSVKFTPKVTGRYRVRVTDARALGGPAFVYRLTVTTENVPEFHYPLRAKPDGLKDALGTSDVLRTPIALNGQIEHAGSANEWKLDLKKAANYTFDLQARRYESPLCGRVTITDKTGQELKRAEGTETSDPAPFAFSPPVDGIYTVRVSERFRGRAGANFVYRLRVLDAPESIAPGFRLSTTTDVFTVPRAGTLKVKVTAERFGTFNGPIVVGAVDLPTGITASTIRIATNQQSADLVLTAGADARIATYPLRLIGVGADGLTIHHGSATFSDVADLRFQVALPTPFKIIDQYVMTSAPRGETYHRKYAIDRGGFDGPIQVQLADRQARHLQGVTGQVLTLKPGQTEFAYPAFLPPWMEMGRTCRVCVMATAKVRDPIDGREHAVSFSSVEQNQQMIVVVGPGRLDVSAEKTSILAEGEVKLAVKVSRSKNLNGPATVELVLPEHVKGVTATKLMVAADKRDGELVLKFAPDAGPFNAPIVVKATVQAETGPVTAETKVEAVR